MNTKREVHIFSQDLQSGAKERICSDEEIEDVLEHETWQKAVKIYNILGECAANGC